MTRTFDETRAETDLAVRSIAVTVPAGPTITLHLLGVFSAGDRYRVLSDVRVDGDLLAVCTEWVGDCFGGLRWTLAISGEEPMAFKSRDALLIAVRQFIAVGDLEG
jgi:hypothetical protein